MDSDHKDRFLRTTQTAATDDINAPQILLHRAYDAILRGDFDAFGEWLADDVELRICGFGSLDGTWRGRADVVTATRRNFGLVSSQKPEIEGMISDGDSVAVMMSESGVFKLIGEPYSIRGVQWFTFANGKIKKIDEIIASIWKVED